MQIWSLTDLGFSTSPSTGIIVAGARPLLSGTSDSKKNNHGRDKPTRNKPTRPVQQITTFKLRSKLRTSQTKPWEGQGTEWVWAWDHERDRREWDLGLGRVGSGNLSHQLLPVKGTVYTVQMKWSISKWPSTLLQRWHHLNGFQTHRTFAIVFESVGSGQRRLTNKELRPFQICRSHLFPLFCVRSLVSDWLRAAESYDISRMQCWLLKGKEIQAAVSIWVTHYLGGRSGCGGGRRIRYYIF